MCAFWRWRSTHSLVPRLSYDCLSQINIVRVCKPVHTIQNPGLSLVWLARRNSILLCLGTKSPSAIMPLIFGRAFANPLAVLLHMNLGLPQSLPVGLSRSLSPIVCFVVSKAGEKQMEKTPRSTCPHEQEGVWHICQLISNNDSSARVFRIWNVDRLTLQQYYLLFIRVTLWRLKTGLGTLRTLQWSQHRNRKAQIRRNWSNNYIGRYTRFVIYVCSSICTY